MYKIFCDGKTVYHPLRAQNKIISGKLDREVNKAGKLTFKIPEDNDCYGLIHLMKSTVTVYENDKLKFRGRPYAPSLNLYKDNEIVCEGELAFLNDIQYPPFEFYGTVEKFLTDLITFYNSKVPENRQFKVGTVNVVNNTIEGYITRSSEDYLKVWQIIDEKLIEMLGGFLNLRHEADGVYIDYLKELNFAGNQPVEQGLNLIDARETTNPESLATVIIPLGAKLLDEDGNETEERLTIEALTGSKYIESEDGIEEFGRIEKTVIHDDITIAGNLETAGKMDLAAALGAPTTLELTAADLSKAGYDVSSFEVGTLVHTKVKNLGIDKRLLVRKLSENLLNPEANRLTIGDSIRRFTSRIAKVKDGKDGKPGKDGLPGVQGPQGIPGQDAILLMIESSAGNLFKNSSIATTLTVTIIVGDITITDSAKMKQVFGNSAKLVWQQMNMGESEFTDIPENDERLSDNGFILTLNAHDISTKAIFNCTLDF